MSAGLLTGFALLLLGAALTSAAPAAAIDDTTRPGARVTHGPSCKPGGLVVEVVAGSVPYTVRLTTTRSPAGEDEARIEPWQTVVLRSGDVAWGETIDGRLEFTAADGSGTAYTDELEEYSFTRPTSEDCAAVARPTDPDPAPPTAGTPSGSPAGTSGSSGDAGAAPPSGSAVAPPVAPPVPTAEPRTSDHAAPAEGAGTPPSRALSPGETVTLEAGGFLPDELVSIRLHDEGAVLGTAIAGPDGTAEAEIRIPESAAAGRTTVDLVGAESAVVADVALRIAGSERGVPPNGGAGLVPLTAAAAALVGSVSALLSVAGGQRASRRRAMTGSV